MINGYIDSTTRVNLQFNMKAIMKAVTINPQLRRRMVLRSTTMVLNKVASLSRRDERFELEFLGSSNHPISLRNIAAEVSRRLSKPSTKIEQEFEIQRPLHVSGGF